VVAIDARKAGETYEVFGAFATMPTGQSPEAWARQAAAEGAGEVLVQSVERDGSLGGYDLELCRRVARAVPVPVLIAGGAGNWTHLVEGIVEGGADGVVTANVYHFTEASIRSAKAHMARAGLAVRT
jgi:cyclase